MPSRVYVIATHNGFYRVETVREKVLHEGFITDQRGLPEQYADAIREAHRTGRVVRVNVAVFR